MREVYGIKDDAHDAMSISLCPERNVDAHFPPTLLVHGNEDTDVPHELSLSMADALHSAGIEHEIVTIRGGGHSFDFPGSPRLSPGLLFTTCASLTRLVAPLIPLRLLPGQPPPRSDFYMSPLLRFLAKHLC